MTKPKTLLHVNKAARSLSWQALKPSCTLQRQQGSVFIDAMWAF